MEKESRLSGWLCSKRDFILELFKSDLPVLCCSAAVPEQCEGGRTQRVEQQHQRPQ